MCTGQTQEQYVLINHPKDQWVENVDVNNRLSKTSVAGHLWEQLLILSRSLFGFFVNKSKREQNINGFSYHTSYTLSTVSQMFL